MHCTTLQIKSRKTKQSYRPADSRRQCTLTFSIQCRRMSDERSPAPNSNLGQENGSSTSILKNSGGSDQGFSKRSGYRKNFVCLMFN